MTKPRLLPASSALRTSLILCAILSAACAPATSTASPAQPVTVEATVTPLPAVPTVDISAQPTAALAETIVPTPFPVATSRGPNLEATDPTTVKMASGGLQLVEFFEFW